MASKAKVYEQRGRFYVQLSWKGKRYRRFHFNDEWSSMPHRDMAERIAQAINADIDNKKKEFDPRQWFRVPGYEFQFSRYADLWLKRNLQEYAPSVKGNVKRYVGLAQAYFGNKDLREIRGYDLDAFLDQGIPSHLSNKTKQNILSSVHVIFRAAKRHSLLKNLPEFPELKVSKPEVKWTTPQWQERILEKIEERDRPIFQFCVAWGCRPGEARALRWGDIDQEKEMITIRRTFSGAGCNHPKTTKTDRERHLPLTEEMKELFARLKVRSLDRDAYVFLNRFGRPYTADLSRIWREARERAGCPHDVTLYQGTRHSFATQHLDNLDVVRIVLGHTRSDMTQRYQGLNLEKVRELIGGKVVAEKKGGRNE